jgi:hypothetical protein
MHEIQVRKLSSVVPILNALTRICSTHACMLALVTPLVARLHAQHTGTLFALGSLAFSHLRDFTRIALAYMLTIVPQSLCGCFA